MSRWPEALDRFAATAGCGPVVAAAQADLTREGRFGSEWVALTRDRLLRFSGDGNGSPTLDVPINDIDSAQVEALVGGASLILTVRGRTMEAARFTNACRRRFSRLAGYLGDLAAYREAVARSDPKAREPVLPPEPEEQQRCPKCGFPLPEGTRICPLCLNKGRVMLRLAAYLKPYWRSMIVVWILMVAGLGAGLVSPYLTRPLMDKVLVPPAESALPIEQRLRLLGWLVLALLASQVASNAINIWRARLLVLVGTRLSHDLRVQVYARLQFLALRFFDKHPIGAMIARVTQDTQSLEAVLVDGMQYFVVNILTLVGIGAVLMAMNWRLTLLALVPVPVVLMLSHLFWRHVMSLWHRYWHYRARVTATVSDSLSGKRVVKVFAKEQEEIRRFETRSGEMLSADTAAEQTWTTLFPVLWFITSTGSLLVWYIGGRQVLGGTLTLGTLMTFQAYLGMFYHPLQFLSRIADYLARSLTSAERVFEVLDSDMEIADAPDAVPLPDMKGSVEFRDVTFGYESYKPALKHVSFTVQPGEMIGLVGRSGAGKSTTVNLICRLFDVQEGAVLIDGTDIRKIRQRDLRSRIGVVLQDTFLFNGTIAENISYANPDAGIEEIMAAAKAANAHDFIVGKTDGYDTKVGERGQLLSGGERQRVSIARAILHNPRILILDEATASVDTDTEKQIQEAIVRMVKGRTTFAIAHRLSTLRNANRIIVLRDGEVIEQGTHQELLDRGGEFHRLVEAQKALSSMVAVGG